MIYKEIYKYEQYKRCSRAITRDLESWSKRAGRKRTTTGLPCYRCTTLINDRRVR